MNGGTIKTKKGASGLAISLVILGIIIIGLIIGIVVNKLHKDAEEISIAESEYDSLFEQASDYFIHGDSEVNINETKSKLENIIKVSKNQDSLTQSAVLLSMLYEEEDQKVSVLTNMLNRNLDDSHRYSILSMLLTVYEDYGREDKYKETLIEIVNLPDDMVLEKENWPMLKKTYKKELDALLGEENAQ